ncbi:MAG: hypothetical protein QOI57_2807 [Rubrobacteraceae bacterium]|jgi:hypothetical protein|nr:hypothetical protein [Rubrobacteraceae bacterium]
MPPVRHAVVVGLLAAVLLMVGGVVGFAASQIWSTGKGGNDRGSMMGNSQTGSMMGGQDMAGVR